MSAVASSSVPAELDDGLDSVLRLSVAQYHALIQTGILGEDDPVELLDGLLIKKMPKSPPHTLATQLAHGAIAGALPHGWFANTQEPLTALESEPEPDVTIIRGKRRDYAARHPDPSDTALVIEVSDTSLRRDRGIKQRVYARAGIPCYWIVNLAAFTLEVYAGAGDDGYSEVRFYQSGEEVPLVLDETEVVRVPVSDLLP